MAEGDGGVSLVAPDGSVGNIPDQPNADGEREAPSVGDIHERRQEAEDELDSRLGEIYDKMNPEGDENVKPPEKRVQRSRAPDGKFTASEAQSAPATEGTGDKTPAAAGEGQGTPATVALPRSWSPSMKEQWDRVPPLAQQLIAERETQAHAAISEQGQELAAYRPLGEVLLSNKDLFHKHRAHPVEAVTRLLDVQRKLDVDAPRTLAAIAKRYNVTAEQIASALGVELAPQQPGSTAPSVKDPRVDQVASRLAKTEQRLAEREARESQAKDAFEASQQYEVDTGVSEWAQDKPYYQHVRERMATLIEAELVDDLDDAYEKACDFNPEIKAARAADQVRQAQAQKAKEEQDRKAQRDRHASEAKRVGRLQLSDTQRPAHRKVNGSWLSDDYLSDVYERVSK